MSGGGLLGRHLRPLLEARDQTVQAMAEAVQNQVPHYRNFATPEQAVAWEAGLGLLLDLFLTLAGENRWLTPTEARAIESIGATRADQGFELSALRRSVRIAASVARAQIIAEYEPVGHEDRSAMNDVLTLLERFSRTVEDLLSEGHMHRVNELRVHANGRAARLVHDVLDGELLEWDAYLERSAAVGCDPHVPRALLLFQEADAPVLLTEAGVVELEGARAVPREAPTPHGVLLLPVALEGKWTSVTVPAIRAGVLELGTAALIAGVFKTPRDLHHGYSGSQPLLPYLRQFPESSPVLEARDFTLHRLVAALPGPVRASLRHEVFRFLRECEPEEAAELLHNLGLFIRNRFKVASVRQATGRHLRTVYKTRRELETVLRKSLDDPAHQMVVTLAFVARELDERPISA